MLIIDKRQRGRHAYGSAGAEARRNIQKQAAHKMMEITLARCGVSVFMTLIVIKCVKIREYSNERSDPIPQTQRRKGKHIKSMQRRAQN